LAALVIGICGGTGAGKTTLARRIVAALAEESAVLVAQDHYYKDLAHLAPEQRAGHNFDHPESVDIPLIIEHLRLLRSGRAIDRPTYDFARHLRENRTVRLQPDPVVIVEGTLLLENRELCELFDLKIFLDTDADVRFIRRLRRDLRERGRTIESVIEQYLASVYPMHKQFIEPSKARADVIIGSDGETEVENLIQKIRASLSITAGTSARPQLGTRAHDSNNGSGMNIDAKEKIETR